MVGQRRLRYLPLRAGFGLLVPVCLLSPVTFAQTDTRYNATTRIDAYGNASPAYRYRRPPGVFQNEVQRQALRGYQARRWPTARRTGFTPLSAAHKVSDRVQAGSTANLVSPYLPAGSFRQRQPAFDRYGGFSRYSTRPGDLFTAFSRRPALLAATSLNAPVHRAFSRTGAAYGVPSPIARMPFVQTREDDVGVAAVGLDQRLRAVADLDHVRVRAEAWAQFREGDYRRAARFFEAAVMLQPSDAESRVGELFCHLSVGAFRTALAVLGELIRRDPNPFIHDLDLTPAYGDAAEARRVRAQTQWQANAADQDADPRALHAFVLWYLGEQDEAVPAATALVRDIPHTAYVDWPAQMRSARSAFIAEPDQSNP